MSLLLHQLVQDYLPSKRRQTPKGWIVFNAPCCHHRGHNADTRSRGNVLIGLDGHIVANCYNCGFKAIYAGNEISKNFQLWLQYLGVPRDKINEAKLEILSKQLNGEIAAVENTVWFKPEVFSEVDMPKHSKPIESWLEQDDISDDLATCIEYLGNRGRAISENYQYWWSPSTKWDLNKRILIPFWYQDKIVGWTGRYAGVPPSNTPRYFNSDVPAGYLFNSDVISNKKRKYVLITEGPFDAIAIDCVGAMGSDLNRQQIAWLNSTDQEKIVVPDRQLKNQKLIDIAIEQGWSVSFPDWEDKIKDAADASIQYGRLYTIHSIIAAKTSSILQINFKRQMMKA
jgi:hypothetical protein